CHGALVTCEAGHAEGCATPRLDRAGLGVDQVQHIQNVVVELEMTAHRQRDVLRESEIETVDPWIRAAEAGCNPAAKRAEVFIALHKSKKGLLGAGRRGNQVTSR